MQLGKVGFPRIWFWKILVYFLRRSLNNEALCNGSLSAFTKLAPPDGVWNGEILLLNMLQWHVKVTYSQHVVQHVAQH